MKIRKHYILAKIEATYGVDPTPTAGTNAILTSGLNRKIYEGNKVTRNLDRATLGADEEINTGPYAMVEFGVEIAGAGAAGDVPAYGPLLRACGFAETITASTSVEYDPVSTGYESITIWYDQDGERQVIKGCRGTVRFSLNAEAIPMMYFTFTGLYAKPTAQSLLVPDISSFLFPLPVNNVNTPTCTFDAYDAIMQTLEIDWGGDVPYFNLVNLEKVDITDRAPAGTATILAPVLATKDMFALAESHNGVTTTDFQLVHGTAAGNIVTIDAPTAQLSGITEVDIKGDLGYQMGMRLLPGASGDDEFKITIT
jgi:hypothetical protein